MNQLDPAEFSAKPTWFFLIILVMIVALAAGLVLRSVGSRRNAGVLAWLAMAALVIGGLFFFGVASVRVQRSADHQWTAHQPLSQLPGATNSHPATEHSLNSDMLATPPMIQSVPAPAPPVDSIEAMWKQLTAPRINLEETTTTGETPTIGPSSPQELTAAAKVILSASVPGADPFTQGWLVNAAKSILGMPVSEQEQLALHQAASEALAANQQSTSAEARSAAIAAPQPQDATDPFAHYAEPVTVSTIAQQPPHDAANLANSASIAALPKPDWVVNPPKQIGNVRRFVVVSDPYLTAEECRRDADQKMQNLALNRAGELSGALSRSTGVATLADLGLGGDYVRRELCTDEFIDVIDSSVGEMRKTYSLVEFNEAQDALLVDRARSYSRQEGLMGVTLIGGGVLASVAALFGLLKADTWTRGYYTKRLLLGVPAAIITVLTLLAVA